jgi:hypothetical protein
MDFDSEEYSEGICIHVALLVHSSALVLNVPDEELACGRFSFQMKRKRISFLSLGKWSAASCHRYHNLCWKILFNTIKKYFAVICM